MMEEPKQVRAVSNGNRGVALAGILGALGGMGCYSLLEDFIPKVKPHKAHTPHQGKKECAKRLKKLGRGKEGDPCRTLPSSSGFTGL